MTDQSPDQQQNLKRNYTVNILDGAFFGFALGFASFSTIIPLFVSYLTPSALIIGLIPAIHNTGWQLPQLLLAKRLGRMGRYKPFVMAMTVHERLPVLGIAITAFLLPTIGKELALILTFLFLIWQALGGGVTANPWQLLMGKIIPANYLAMFFGLQGAAANLLASGSAILAGWILETLESPWDFSATLFIACIFFTISWFFLNLTREEEKIVVTTSFSELPLWKSVRSILAKDRSFRWYLVTRIVAQFGNMAMAFYTVHAVRNLGMSELVAGVMTGILMMSQVIANPLLGWLGDRWGKRRALILGSSAIAFSTLLAWYAPDLNYFYGVFLLAGIGSSAYWTIGMAYTMSFGTDEERPTYVGMANTLIAPAAILAPLLGGWMADQGGFKLTFLTAAISAAIGVLILWFFVRDNQSSSGNIISTEPAVEPQQ